MSVEEARWEAHGAINDLAYRNADLWLAERAHDAIDRLILEVQAEMPCSGRQAVPLHGMDAKLSDICSEDEFIHDLCPSCTARNKLSGVVSSLSPHTP